MDEGYLRETLTSAILMSKEVEDLHKVAVPGLGHFLIDRESVVVLGGDGRGRIINQENLEGRIHEFMARGIEDVEGIS